MADKTPPIDEQTARELLKSERERIESSLSDLGRLIDEEKREIDDDTDAVEAGGHIEEEQVDEALVRKLRRERDAVERAEKRVEDGTYGFSIDSGEPIPAERLKAIPWAERTADEER